MKFINYVVSFVVYSVQLICDIVILFLLFTLIGAFWGRNTNEVLHTEGVPLYIHGDGFHTELYLPVKDSLGMMNWMDWFDDTTIRHKHATASLINFAWAEEDWTTAGASNRPKGIQTTLEIFFSPWNKSVLHVQWMNQLWPLKKAVTIKRYLNSEQYLQLIRFITGSFVIEKNKPAIRSYTGYYGWDYLYKSNRNYNSFNTCNQFTSDALNACGVRNATFSPFGWGLFYQLKK